MVHDAASRTPAFSQRPLTSCGVYDRFTDSGPSCREIALRVMKRVISHTTAWAMRERTRSFTIMPTRAAASISAR